MGFFRKTQEPDLTKDLPKDDPKTISLDQNEKVYKPVRQSFKVESEDVKH